MIDWMVQLPRTADGNGCIITCTDALTKWTETRATPQATARESARFFLDQVVMKYGAPMAVATDNGTHFMGEFDELLRKLHIAHHWGSPYHPQSTGQAEKTNGLIMGRIRRWMSSREEEWDRFLAMATLSVNSRRSERMKMSPMEALFGKTPKAPYEVQAALASVDNLAERFEAIEEASEPGERLRLLGTIRDEAIRVTQVVNDKMMKRFGGGLPKFEEFNVGTTVLVKRLTKKKSKLSKPWMGPGKIVSKGDLGAMRVQMPSGDVIRRNVHDLKLFVE
jgi:hypothetical protein